MNKLEMIKTIEKELIPLIEETKQHKYEYIQKLNELETKDYDGEWQKYRYVITNLDRDLMGWGDKNLMLKLDKIYEKAKEAIASKVENKLKDIKVDTIVLKEISGYDIEFKINDSRRFTVLTVQAGGYHIQCLHYRTTYKLWKA